MKRVAVIGCCGAGKSVFSSSLAKLTGLPLIHLDRMFWERGWVPADPAVFRERAAFACAEPAWIMDGNYLSTLKERLESADTVVFLDFPTWLCLLRVLRRTLLGFGRTRPDVADGCPERFDWPFLKYVIRFRSQFRPRVLELLEGPANYQLIHARNPREARAALLAVVRLGAPAFLET